MVEVAASSRHSVSSLHRQRGAAAVFVGIAFLALLTATMLAIETGRLYSTHRQLQKAATLAALDGARVVSGCTGSTPTQILLNNQVNSSLVSNGYDTASGVTSVAEPGTIQTVTANGVQQRVLLPSAVGTANAVRVTLSAPFPAQIIPIFQSGGTMRVSATATQDALGSLRVGSGLADVNLTKSLLSALLGGNVSVADYNGLANASVTSAQLATALGVSVKDLSSATSLTQTTVLGTALSGLSSALGSTVSQQVRDSLQNLAGQSTNNTPIPLADILGPVGNLASDVPFLNLQDVVMALALASRTDPSGNPQPIQLNNIPALSLPGVATVSAYVKVIEAPVLSNLGKAGALTDPKTAQASTAQVRLMIRIDGSGAGNLLSALNLINIPFVAQVTAVPNLKIGIDVDVAKATAWLNTLSCPRIGTNNGYPIAGPNATTAIAAVTVGTFTTTTGAVTPASSIPLATVKLLGITLADLALGINATVGSTPHTLNNVTQFKQCKRNSNFPATCDDVTAVTTPTLSSTVPVYRALGAPGTPTVPAASPTTANPQLISSQTGVVLNLSLTGGASLVGAVLTPVTSLLNPLLTFVNTTLSSVLINPLLNLLGVSAGTAAVTMDLVTVGQPVVVTTALP